MRFLLLLLFSVSFFNVNAQHRERDGKKPRPSREKIEAHKIAFITSELDLSTEEAQVFWPIFNEYEKEKKAIRKERKQEANLDELSDAQADEMIKEHLENKSRNLELETQYVEKFKDVLPSKKVLKLMIIDRKFKEEVLKDLQRRLDRRQER